MTRHFPIVSPRAASGDGACCGSGAGRRLRAGRRGEEAHTFFPPPPELPRIQYLNSFRGRKDIEHQTAFNRFVVGEKPNVQLDKPYGIAIHKGRLYVCDTNRTVQVFDLERQTFER